MPNHVTNRLMLLGADADVSRFLNDLKSPTEATVLVDFNQIRPMPQELRGTLSGSNDIIPDEGYADAIAALKATHDAWASEWIVKTGRPREEFGYVCQLPVSKSMARDYMARFGAYNWYDWARENWETKWGGYNSRYDEALPNVVWYDTAWSAGALGLLREMSQRHPLLRIVHDWADEDTGSNVGRRTWHNGLMAVPVGASQDGYFKDNRRQAMLHAIALHRNEEFYYDKNDPAERWPFEYIDPEYDTVPVGATPIAEEVKAYRLQVLYQPTSAASPTLEKGTASQPEKGGSDAL